MAEEGATTAAAVDELTSDRSGEHAREQLTKSADVATAELLSETEADATNGTDAAVEEDIHDVAAVEPASEDAPDAAREEGRRRSKDDRDRKGDDSVRRGDAGVSLQPPVTSSV